MKIYSITIQSVVFGKSNPLSWSMDEVLEYLMDRPDMVGDLSVSELITSELASMQVQKTAKHQPPQEVAAPSLVTLEAEEPKDVPVRKRVKRCFSLDWRGQEHRPSAVSSNGSKVVHHANGSHEFYDADVDEYYSTATKYRFRQSTGQLEFEYRSHDYLFLSKSSGVGTRHKGKTRTGKGTDVVYLTKREARVIRKAVYDKRDINLKNRLAAGGE